MPSTSADLSEIARYRAALEELIADWDRRLLAQRPIKSASTEQLLFVSGFAAQGYEQARAYLAAVNLVPETALMPLIRAVFEQAITAQWLMLVPEGWKAVAQDYAEQRRKLARDLRSLGLVDSSDQVEAQARYHPDRLMNPHTQQGSDFSARCRDLTTRDVYLQFRLLSAESHPTVAVLGKWVREPTEKGGPIRLVKPPSATDGYWAGLLATSLVLLAGAVNEFDGDEGRRQFLKQMAKKLDTMPQLRLSETHHKRVRRGTPGE